MKKEDLKSGMVVEIRNGDLYLVVGDFITREDEFILLQYYNDDMTDVSVASFDIMKVYMFTNALYGNAAPIKTLLDRDRLTLLWERKEYKLTEREVEVLKALKTLDYEWLARDESDSIYTFRTKPEKCNHMWLDNSNKNHVTLDKHLFKFIKWEDENPTNIKELLK